MFNPSALAGLNRGTICVSLLEPLMFSEGFFKNELAIIMAIRVHPSLLWGSLAQCNAVRWSWGGGGDNKPAQATQAVVR